MEPSLSVTACPCCGRIAESLGHLLRHVRLFHFGTPGFRTLKCNLEGCRKIFKKYAVFRNHIYEHHANSAVNISHSNNSSTNNNSTNNRSTNTIYNDTDSDSGENMDTEIISHVTSSDSMKKAAAIWILKTQEINKLTQSTTEKIMQDTGALYEAALSNLHSDVVSKLQEEGVEISTIHKLSSIFSPTGCHGNLFSGLESQFLQMKYFSTHFHFIVS